jgi:hypothetical protein
MDFNIGKKNEITHFFFHGASKGNFGVVSVGDSFSNLDEIKKLCMHGDLE